MGEFVDQGGVEVSAAIAELFQTYAREYQEASAHAKSTARSRKRHPGEPRWRVESSGCSSLSCSVIPRISLMPRLIHHCDVSACYLRVGVRARATASASLTSRRVEPDSVPR
ncbi:PE family protein [Mycobacterium kansasii]